MVYRRIVIIGIALFALPALLHAKGYEQYTYESGKQNYHLTETKMSADGEVTVTIGGSGVTADEKLVIFTPKQSTPAWEFEDTGGSVIFEVDISADGSTIVACGGGVWVVDVATQALLWEYQEGVQVWDTCRLSADGGVIVAGSRENIITAWDRASSTPLRTWSFTNDEDFIDHVVISPDGTKGMASQDKVMAFFDIDEADLRWEMDTPEGDFTEIGMDETATRGFAMIQSAELGDDAHSLRGLNLGSGKLTWKKIIASSNTPYTQMSADGKRIVVSSNKVYYGINGKNGKTAWTFKQPDPDNTTLGMSENAQFIVITEGIENIYLFDWTYPRAKQRPFQINQAVFPAGAAMSQDGSAFAYTHNDLTFEQIMPGILVDTQNIPVYQAGMDVKLRYHVSNPGVGKNLKIRTSLSLPQVSILSDLGATVDGEPQSAKAKLLDYANKTLPGYEVAETRSVAVAAHDSKTIQATFAMPEMVLPDWVGDLLELLGLDNIFDDLFAELAEPLADFVNDQLNTAMTSEADSQFAAGGVTYPLLGLGQVELYDPETNEVYSNDTFFFLYLL